MLATSPTQTRLRSRGRGNSRRAVESECFGKHNVVGGQPLSIANDNPRLPPTHVAVGGNSRLPGVGLPSRPKDCTVDLRKGCPALRLHHPSKAPVVAPVPSSGRGQLAPRAPARPSPTRN